MRPELESDGFTGTEQTFWIGHGDIVRESRPAGPAGGFEFVPNSGPGCESRAKSRTELEPKFWLMANG